MTARIETQIYEQSGPFRSEDDFQIATAKLLDELQRVGLLSWVFTGNNLYRRALARRKLQAVRLGALSKRMGSKPGVHDCLIYSHKVTIELKNGKGNYSPEQREWKDEAEKWGWRCYLGKTPGEVVDILQREGFEL